MQTPDEDYDWVFVKLENFCKSKMVAPAAENPITGICIVSDRTRAPPGFEPIVRSHDEPTQEADVWKDSFFSLSSIKRYICVCKTIQADAFTCNVVADISIVNDKDLVPPGFVPLEFTTDTREKALRKKQLCVRSVPRDSAVDAVSDLVILCKNKRPPKGYTLAGEVDGLCICFKYSVIPQDFPTSTGASPGGQQGQQNRGVHPGLPYPVHPSLASNGPESQSYNFQAVETAQLVQRSESSISGKGGIEGIPFELNARLKAGGSSSQSGWPNWKEFSPVTLETEFAYPFLVEQQVLEQSLTNSP